MQSPKRGRAGLVPQEFRRLRPREMKKKIRLSLCRRRHWCEMTRSSRRAFVGETKAVIDLSYCGGDSGLLVFGS